MNVRVKNLVFSVVIFAIVYLFFQLFLPGHLYFREQCQLFLFSGEYFASYLLKPAPLLNFLSDFLTQFFYLRFAGAAIIALIATIEYNLFRVALNHVNLSLSSLFSLLPTIADVLIQCKIFHSLAFQLSSISFVLLFLLLIIIDSKNVELKIKFTLQLLLTLLFTALCGASSIVALLCFAVFKRNYLHTLISTILITISIITLLLIRLKLVIPITESFLAPFPASKYAEFIIINLCAVLSICCSIFIHRNRVIPIVICIITTIFCGYKYINLQTEKYLYIDTQYYFGNHQNVIKALGEMNDVNNRYISYYANLESARQGTLSDDLLQHYQPFETSLFIIPNPNINWHSMLIGYEAYALAGCENMAQHAAMLGNTFSISKHNVRAIEYLAEINLNAGDTLAAKKYLRMLSKSLFHKELHNHYIPHIIHKTDTIFSPNNIQAQLKKVADENPYNQTTLDYLLSYQLLTKNLVGFFESVQKYHPLHYGRYYKEAMMIVASVNKLNINELGIERDIIERFFDYEKHYKAGNRDYLKNKYWDTYWYYYHFAQPKDS